MEYIIKTARSASGVSAFMLRARSRTTNLISTFVVRPGVRFYAAGSSPHYEPGLIIVFVRLEMILKCFR